MPINEGAQVMRVVLDTVGQGIVLIDAEGVIADARSAAFDRFFCVPERGTTLFAHLGRHAPSIAGWLRVGLEIVFDNALPVDVALDQLPKSIELADRTLRIEYQAVRSLAPVSGTSASGGDAPPEKLVVMFIDITSDVARERAEREQREAFQLFQRFVSDPCSVVDFSEDALELVAELQEAKSAVEVALRIVHTLKGNAASFDLRSIAQLCHQLETKIVEQRRPLTRDEIAVLRNQVYAVVEHIRVMAGQRGQRVDVAERDIAHLTAALERRAPHEEMLALVRLWKWQPARPRLVQFAAQAQSLARRLDKGEVVVDVADGLRFPPDALRGFFASFVHVVRNAIDHGLESPHERAASGKRGPPTVRLGMAAVDDALVVSVSDDGRGIDWDRVRAKAVAANLPSDSHDQLLAALMADGFSTREDVSETSGRGVGMAVVQYAVEELGGRVGRVRARAGHHLALRVARRLCGVVSRATSVRRGGRRPRARSPTSPAAHRAARRRGR
jgi:HPt (histidine-containing phosphotransfer) domain-containing protein